jgi:hypothetical protein
MLLLGSSSPFLLSILGSLALLEKLRAFFYVAPVTGLVAEGAFFSLPTLVVNGNDDKDFSSFWYWGPTGVAYPIFLQGLKM